MRAVSGGRALPVTVATSAFPFVPATISLANMTSTYVPADVYARLLRMLGHASRHITAVDVHSQFVSVDGRTRDRSETMCREKTLEYAQALAAMNVSVATLRRTDDAVHVAAVRRAIRVLLSKGMVVQRKIAVRRCSSCGAAPPARLLEDFDFERLGLVGERHEVREPRCPYCHGTRFADAPSDHWFLPLEPFRTEVLDRADDMLKVEAARPLVRRWLSEPLADWNITRDNQIGISLDEYLPGKSLYLWFESLVGYWSMADVSTSAPRRFAHFFGMNILYYHAVVWPILYHLCKDGELGEIALCPRGLVDKRRSDPELLDLRSATGKYHRDYLRFYVLWASTDGLADVCLTEDGLIQTVNSIVCDNIGNLLRRVAVLLLKRRDVGVRLDNADPVMVMFQRDVVPAIRRAADDLAISRCLRIVVDYAHELNRIMSVDRLYEQRADNVNGRLAFMIASMLVLLAPFMPTLVHDFNVFTDWQPGIVDDAATAVRSGLKSDVGVWPKLM